MNILLRAAGLLLYALKTRNKKYIKSFTGGGGGLPVKAIIWKIGKETEGKE
jgi:hypothetical protein